MPWPLSDEAYDQLLEHFERHAAENGREGFWFMAPGQEPSVSREALELPLSEPCWARIWMLEHDGQVKGHVLVEGNAFSSHRCTLSMGVEADARGQGVGRTLMTLAVSWCAAQHELSWIDGWALAHNKPVLALDKSVGFYEVGFIEDALRVDGVSYDQMILALRLR
jgi:GNAT superfamily N-acetyltransferase